MVKTAGFFGQCVLDNVIMCLEVGLHGKNCRVFWTMLFGQ